jgi:hypothetical protein
MAPLTRSRSLQPWNIPSDLMREYYTQRASDGGFIIAEAMSISITGGDSEHPDFTQTNRSKDGRRLLRLFMRRAATCSRNFGILDARRTLRRQAAKPLFQLQSIRPTGRMIRTLFPQPAAGSNLHHIAFSISQKFLASSRITAKPLRTTALPACLQFGY